MARHTATVAVLVATVLLARGERHVVRPHGPAWPRAPEEVAEGTRRSPRPRRAGLHRWGGPVASLLLSAAVARSQPPNFMSFEAMDADGDGIVDKEEYMLSAKAALNADGHKDMTVRKSVYHLLASLFDVCDLDHDGSLQPREVQFAEFLIASAVQTVISDPMAKLQVAPDGAIVGDHNDFQWDSAMELMGYIDVDGDKHANLSEFGGAFRKAFEGWGWGERDFEHPSLQQVMRSLFETADVSGDGRLSGREMQYGAYLLNGFAVDEMSHSVFRDLDVNANGMIERSEVQAASKLARRNMPRGETSVVDVIMEMFTDKDANGDGSLDADEVRELARELLEMSRAL